MHLEDLANELLLQIFHSCTTLSSVLSLATTSRRFHSLLQSQKLPILFNVFDAQYGPLHDAMQLVTHNATQPVHHLRSAPYSLALLQQLLSTGRTASQYEQLYPFKKWKLDSENRRLLSDAERWKVRRAVYRLFLYSRAFHNARYTRTMRMLPHVVQERLELLHNWTTDELAEMEDVRSVMRELVRGICPSNGSIQRKFKKRFPDDGGGLLGFNIHLNYPPPSPTNANTVRGGIEEQFHSYLGHGVAEAKAVPGRAVKFAAGGGLHDMGAEGWGDDVLHYYVVEDMLKLDPGQILFLREHLGMGGWDIGSSGRKDMVKGFVYGLGEWFENNGETFGQTLELVVTQRGENVEEFKEDVLERERGVVIE